MSGKNSETNKYYLMCERNWIYDTLIAIGGILGAYTYLLRGNVFCNAQTGNVVLMGMAFGSGDWYGGLYYLIPISAYIAGAFVSDLVPNAVRRIMPIRWDTLLIAIEMGVVVWLGFVPLSAPVQIAQVAINFIASMQYNTFRQSEGVPMATTFVTNHIRQIGIGLAKEIKHRKSEDKSFRRKTSRHMQMLLFFAGGSAVGTVFCNLIAEKAIWITVVPFGIVFGVFLYADLKTEKDMIYRKPSGH